MNFQVWLEMEGLNQPYVITRKITAELYFRRPTSIRGIIEKEVVSGSEHLLQQGILFINKNCPEKLNTQVQVKTTIKLDEGISYTLSDNIYLETRTTPIKGFYMGSENSINNIKNIYRKVIFEIFNYFDTMRSVALIYSKKHPDGTNTREVWLTKSINDIPDFLYTPKYPNLKTTPNLKKTVKSKSNKCICSVDELMVRGCKCGGV